MESGIPDWLMRMQKDIGEIKARTDEINGRLVCLPKIEQRLTRLEVTVTHHIKDKEIHLTPSQIVDEFEENPPLHRRLGMFVQRHPAGSTGGIVTFIMLVVQYLEKVI